MKTIPRVENNVKGANEKLKGSQRGIKKIWRLERKEFTVSWMKK